MSINNIIHYLEYSIFHTKTGTRTYISKMYVHLNIILNVMWNENFSRIYILHWRLFSYFLQDSNRRISLDRIKFQNTSDTIFQNQSKTAPQFTRKFYNPIHMDDLPLLKLYIYIYCKIQAFQKAFVMESDRFKI